MLNLNGCQKKKKETKIETKNKNPIITLLGNKKHGKKNLLENIRRKISPL